jgi:hypothetical protein
MLSLDARWRFNYIGWCLASVEFFTTAERWWSSLVYGVFRHWAEDVTAGMADVYFAREAGDSASGLFVLDWSGMVVLFVNGIFGSNKHSSIAGGLSVQF